MVTTLPIGNVGSGSVDTEKKAFNRDTNPVVDLKVCDLVNNKIVQVLLTT